MELRRREFGRKVVRKAFKQHNRLGRKLKKLRRLKRVKAKRRRRVEQRRWLLKRSAGWLRWRNRVKYATRWKPFIRFTKPSAKVDSQVAVVRKDGRKMRCITKTAGRQIYRPLKPKFPKWWKRSRASKKLKSRKSEKVLWQFKWWGRARNSSEVPGRRRRKFYSRRKKRHQFRQWQLNLTPAQFKRRQAAWSVGESVQSLGVAERRRAQARSASRNLRAVKVETRAARWVGRSKLARYRRRESTVMQRGGLVGFEQRLGK